MPPIGAMSEHKTPREKLLSSVQSTETDSSFHLRFRSKHQSIPWVPEDIFFLSILVIRGKETLSNVSAVYFILGILRTDLWSHGSQYEGEVLKQGHPTSIFGKYLFEDDLRSRISGTFFIQFLACLPLLGFSNI